MLTTVFNS